MRLVTAMIAVNANPKVSIMRKRLLILATLAAGCASLLAQTPAWQPAAGHPTLLLWPNGAPGAPPNPAPEIDTTTAKDNLIAGKPLIRLGNVSSPTLTLYAARDRAPQWWFFLGAVTAYWPLTWKGPRCATGSIPQASTASW